MALSSTTPTTEVTTTTEDSGAADLYPIIVNNKHAYIDHMGAVVIPARFREALPFSEGLAPVAEFAGEGVRPKHGYIDVNGNWAIQPQLWEAFYDQAKRLWGYLDKTSAVSIEPRFTDARRFSEGLAAAAEKFAPNGSPVFGYIDTSGSYVIPAQYVLADPFSGGLAYVVARDASGASHRSYIDNAGTAVWTHAVPFGSTDQASVELRSVILQRPTSSSGTSGCSSAVFR